MDSAKTPCHTSSMGQQCVAASSPNELDNQFRGDLAHLSLARTNESAAVQRPTLLGLQPVIRRMDQSLSKHVDLSRAAAEIAGDFVGARGIACFVTDGSGTIVQCNSEACDTLQVDRKRYLLGKPLSVFVTFESQRAYFGALNQLVKRKSRPIELTLRIRTRAGATFVGGVTVSPIRDKNTGDATNLLSWSIKDVSDVVTYQNEITQLQSQLNLKSQELKTTRESALQLAQAKDRFVANMSHEMRTPLNGVLAAVQLLMNSSLDAEQTELAKIITSSATLLTDVVSGILDMSKIESGHIDLQPTRQNLNEILQETVSSIKSLSERKNIPLQIKMSAECPQIILVDKQRLKQVLLNLLSNSIKFTDHGQIDLEVSRISHSKLLFTVKDTGIGISDSTIDFIFEPFYQGDNSSTRQYGGTGLGLAISKHLVEMMGGNISVESTPGEGSTFVFTLPLVEPASHHVDANAQSLSSDAYVPTDQNLGATSRILIAEDNNVNARILGLQLQKLGYQYDRVHNGHEAVQAVLTNVYDAILMDCQMPIKDGYQAAMEIKNGRKPNQDPIPIIAITANAMQGDLEKCVSSGMDDYLAKPLTVEQLSGVLNKWIPGSNLSA